MQVSNAEMVDAWDTHMTSLQNRISRLYGQIAKDEIRLAQHHNAEADDPERLDDADAKDLGENIEICSKELGELVQRYEAFDKSDLIPLP